MNKPLLSVRVPVVALCVCLLGATACSLRGGADNAGAPGAPVAADTVATACDTVVTGVPVSEIPAGAAVLLEAYPDMVKSYADNRLTLADGTVVEYDDGREKDFVTMLDHSDPEDMFSMTYSRQSPPEYLADAGRSRCEQLFKAMYGASAAKVRSHLVPVSWFGQKVDFTAVNGAADSLRAVAAELAAYPELKPYLKSSGAFYWRKVRGAERQSAHSYGIAFDIAVDKSDYWLWKNPRAAETDRIAYHNRIPAQLVDVFERHGFIWGGAWYHYDTMHFEFRPEILRYAARQRR